MRYRVQPFFVICYDVMLDEKMQSLYVILNSGRDNQAEPTATPQT